MEHLFQYVDNRKGGEEIFRCVAGNILDADEALKEATGIIAVKSPWIGCRITFDSEI